MTRTTSRFIAYVGLAAVLAACIEAVPPGGPETKAHPTGLEHLEKHGRVLAGKSPDEKVVIVGVLVSAELGREVIQELGFKWAREGWPLVEPMAPWYFRRAFLNQLWDLMGKNKIKISDGDTPDRPIEQQIEKTVAMKQAVAAIFPELDSVRRRTLELHVEGHTDLEIATQLTSAERPVTRDMVRQWLYRDIPGVAAKHLKREMLEDAISALILPPSRPVPPDELSIPPSQAHVELVVIPPYVDEDLTELRELPATRPITPDEYGPGIPPSPADALPPAWELRNQAATWPESVIAPAEYDKDNRRLSSMESLVRRAALTTESLAGSDSAARRLALRAELREQMNESAYQFVMGSWSVRLPPPSGVLGGLGRALGRALVSVR